MSSVLLNIHDLKKFDDAKRHKETIWSGDDGNISLLGLKPGQEIVTHTHHGNHIFIVIEGEGEYLSEGKAQPLQPGVIVIVPPHDNHGIRNSSKENLVIASITSQGD
jgi:quercetin dioxygenase-like cupin family protein